MFALFSLFTYITSYNDDANQDWIHPVENIIEQKDLVLLEHNTNTSVKLNLAEYTTWLIYTVLSGMATAFVLYTLRKLIIYLVCTKFRDIRDIELRVRIHREEGHTDILLGGGQSNQVSFIAMMNNISNELVEDGLTTRSPNFELVPLPNTSEQFHDCLEE
jgi:hypothetical protein